MDASLRHASVSPTGLGRGLRRASTSALLAAAVLPGVLLGQAAIDPNVAPRAAALEREGERQMAIDLLGRYLATAPDDGRAWLQLGRFYLYDAREWHLHGHGGDPDGPLYLDFAATALEQAIRLSVDSGLVFRGLAEVERALIVVEDSGWENGRYARARTGTPAVPPYMLELGLNLLGSCPSGGVLLTGSDLEALSVWYGNVERPTRDIIPIRPDLYATDSIYRRRMADAMGVDPTLPVQRALAMVAPQRPLCLSPGTDSAAVPALAWVPFRLVRLSQPPAPGADGLSVTELLKATRQSGSPWVMEVRAVYDRAARHNALLCSSLLLLYGDAPPAACRP
ncbi:MAG TPA: tetratricopeptide repeat protein [Methylomirabilota bacterium]|nr:tetratricopeptide repeat protein [Methylomirabilota bacterium]